MMAILRRFLITKKSQEAKKGQEGESWGGIIRITGYNGIP
jgi:hypothetical protein